MPAVHIYLSLDEIDAKTIGHQTTNVPTKFWPVPKKHEDSDYVFRQKKNNSNHRGGGGNYNRPKMQKVDGSSGSNNRNKNNNKSKEAS